jgi:hypothetical protein
MYMYINIMNELNDELDGEVLNYVVELADGRPVGDGWNELSEDLKTEILGLWQGFTLNRTIENNNYVFSMAQLNAVDVQSVVGRQQAGVPTLINAHQFARDRLERAYRYLVAEDANHGNGDPIHNNHDIDGGGKRRKRRKSKKRKSKKRKSKKRKSKKRKSKRRRR